MEACVRHLRVPKDNPAGRASFLLIQDTLQTLGQQAICLEVVSQLQLYAARSQVQSTLILVLAFDQPTVRYCTHGSNSIHVLDLFSDPFGWSGLSTGSTQHIAWRTGDGLQAVQQAVEAYLQLQTEQAKDGKLCCHLVLDSLGCMLQHTKLNKVLVFLEDIRRHACISSICAGLHQDLHEPQVVAALTRLCTASLQLQPIQGLLQEVAALSQGKQGGPHGQLQLCLKRHTGRVRVETELYSLHQDGSLHTSAVPQEAITAQLLAAHAVQHADVLLQPAWLWSCLPRLDAQLHNFTWSAYALTVCVVWQAASEQQKDASMQARQVQAEEEARLALLTHQAGMKLTLTEQEQAARQAVVLPYEHQGVGQAYQTGDFKDYLPKAAGGQGKGAGQGSLGHILYVRDSASEHDSDEDPDDDLDI